MIMGSELNTTQISSQTIDGSGGSTFTGSIIASDDNNSNGSVTNGATATINADMTGSGTFIVGNGADTRSSTLTLNGLVGSGETAQVNAGTLLIDQPPSFAGSIDWNYYAGSIPAEIILAGTHADSFSFNGSEMSFFQAGFDVLNITIHQQNQSGLAVPWSVSQTPQGTVISSLDPSQIVGAAPLAELL
jgi:hypothetical protein